MSRQEMKQRSVQDDLVQQLDRIARVQSDDIRQVFAACRISRTAFVDGILVLPDDEQDIIVEAILKDPYLSSAVGSTLRDWKQEPQESRIRALETIYTVLSVSAAQGREGDGVTLETVLERVALLGVPEGTEIIMRSKAEIGLLLHSGFILCAAENTPIQECPVNNSVPDWPFELWWYDKRASTCYAMECRLPDHIMAVRRCSFRDTAAFLSSRREHLFVRGRVEVEEYTKAKEKGSCSSPKVGQNSDCP